MAADRDLAPPWPRGVQGQASPGAAIDRHANAHVRNASALTRVTRL